MTRVTETPFNIGLPLSNRATVDRNSVRSMTRETQGRPDSVSIPVVAVSESGQTPTAKSPLKGLDDLQTQMFDMLSTALNARPRNLKSHGRLGRYPNRQNSEWPSWMWRRSCKPKVQSTKIL